MLVFSEWQYDLFKHLVKKYEIRSEGKENGGGNTRRGNE